MKNKILKIILTIIFSTTLFFGRKEEINAATGSISVKSSAYTVVVGNTFTVTVTISSKVALGSWEYSIDYNSALLTLTSGSAHVVDYGNGSIKSRSYTYKFKAKASGSARIGVKSYSAYDWNEQSMSLTAGSATIKTMTQSQLEATYSKNNNLSSLSVEGATLTPAFNKDILEYIVNLGANVENIVVNASKEDSKASISGIGTIPVSEGENKINIVVTAQNGSQKTYVIIATVVDPNPIEVTSTTGEKFTIVKRESLLTMPDTFTKTTTLINDIEIPSFYSELTKYTLVGLKNNKGEISLHIYDSESDTYTLYNEILFEQLKLFPMDFETDKFEGYKKSKITINDHEVVAYKLTNSSEFAIIYAMNIETGKKDYYLFDSVENTVTRYNQEESDYFNNKIKNYYSVIIGLGIESIILLTVLVVMLIKNYKRKEKNTKTKEKDESILEEKNDIKKEKKNKSDKK